MSVKVHQYNYCSLVIAKLYEWYKDIYLQFLFSLNEIKIVFSSIQEGVKTRKVAKAAAKMEDEDRRNRLVQLETTIQDNRSIINVDCLLDAIQALVADCDHPAIRKIKNVDAFVNRCKFLKVAYLLYT